MFFWILRPEVSGLWMTSVKNPPPDLSGSPFKKGEQKIPSAKAVSPLSKGEQKKAKKSHSKFDRIFFLNIIRSKQKFIF